MRPSRYAGNLRARRFGAAVLSVLFFWGGIGYADRLPPDPAEELRRALEAEADKAVIDSRIAALRTLGEMRRGLTAEWKEKTLKSRDLLAERFRNSAQAAIRDGDRASRLAAIVLVGEMGQSTAGTDTAVTGLAQGFVPDLAEIVRRGEPGLSEAAARSLGRIAFEPKVPVAVPALAELITAPAVSQRLAAAQAMTEMIQNLVQTSGLGKLGTRPDTAELARLGQAVVPAATKGLADADRAVRRRSMETIYVASGLLTRLGGARVTGLDGLLPPVAPERREMAPLMQALVEQAPALARALSDPDPEVRRLAGRTLENMAFAREQPQRGLSPAPPPPAKDGRTGSEKKPDGPSLGAGGEIELELMARLQAVAQAAGDDPLLPGLRKVLQAVIEAVADPDERVRLAVIDVLEALGPEAAPAVPALTAALGDRNRFVIWSAARALGRIGPTEHTPAAVSGLIRTLDYLDVDVRLAAVLALERLGPAARAAVPALAQSVRLPDPNLRMAALRALVGIGTDAQPALPAMAAAVADPDARVRRTAAESLGRFGVAARGAADALTRALDDGDADVRRAASDALLNVLPAGGR